MTDLEQRLRAALRDDAEHARLVHPDGPAAAEPRPLGSEPSRARPMAWVAVAAAFVVLALVAALTMLDADESVDTLGPPDTAAPGPAGPMDVETVEGSLEPGQYFIDPDGDPATSMRVTYEIPDDGAWEQWIGASRITGGPHTMLSIAMVSNVVRHGCTDHQPLDPAVGPSVDDLATALTQLAPFEVTSPPRDVMLFGYEGKHVALTVPDIDFSTCTGGVLDGWISPLLGPNSDEAFFGYNGPEPGLTEEFWILDVDGARLVIITNTSPDAPAEWITQRQAIIDSIRIVPAIEA